MNGLDQVGSRYDVVVIGARAAGAATAMLLARRGLNVLAVDRGVYGSDTLSTHALMRAGVLQLARWGLLDRIQAAGTPPVTHTAFHYDDEVLDIPIKPRDGVPALFAPRRTVLDRVLVDAAVEAGATVRHRVQLADLVRDERDRVWGVRLRDEAGADRIVRCDRVIGADGMRSTVAALAGATITQPGRHAAASFYGYWSGLEADGYHWYWGHGAAAGTIPTNDGQVLVYVGASAERFASEMRGRVPEAYRALVDEVAPELAARLGTARLVGSLHGFAGQAGFLRRSWGRGWALVGDAAYFKDPITAHGISDALRDAEFLARAVVRGNEAAMREYEATRDALSHDLFEITDRIAAFDWSHDQLKELHHAFSDAMKGEIAALVALDEEESEPVQRIA